MPVAHGQINFEIPWNCKGVFDEIAIADFHNDGLLDFVTFENGRKIQIFRNW